MAGHRIAAYHIVQYREAGFGPEEFKGLELAEVREALDYADQHSDKMDDDRLSDQD